jgi:hypothetical protein
MNSRVLTNAGLSVAFLALISAAAMAQDVSDDGVLNALDPVVDVADEGDESVDDENPDEKGLGVDSGLNAADEFSLNPLDHVVDVEGAGNESYEEGFGADRVRHEGNGDAIVYVLTGLDGGVFAQSGEVDEGAGEEVSIEEVWVDEGTSAEDWGNDGMLSDCGGCEYLATDGADQQVMQNVPGKNLVGQPARRSDEANDIDVFARGNICFSTETYVGFLCDWQRSFLGDKMPAQ